MSEERLSEELAAVEAALASLRPAPSRIRRDRLLRLAGQISAAPRSRRSVPGLAGGRRAIRWATGLATAACLLVALAWLWPRRGETPALPGPNNVPQPPVQLAAGWQVQPTGKADYRVMKPDLIRLRRGELLVESLPSADGEQPRPALRIETPAGVATASGMKSYIGVHTVGCVKRTTDSSVRSTPPTPNPIEPEGVVMTSFTRVLVLAGMVTLANAQGSVTGQANHLLAAEPGKAPVNYAVTADAGFAVDLYQELCKENPGKNLFFSPYSMSSALAMAAEGARGETAAEMGKVLCFPEAARRVGDDAQLIPWNVSLIHTGMAELNERFNAPKPASKAIRGKIDSQYELHVANALWAEKTYPFQPSYLETIRKYYAQGGAFPADFRNQPEPSRLRINAWVEEQTHQRIKDLLPPGSVDSSTRLALTNAIYFKGEWPEVFSKGATKEDDFLLADGGKARVRMMRHDGLGWASYAAFNGDGTLFDTPRAFEHGKSPPPSTCYPDKDGFTMLEMPYKGDDLSMVVIVPQAADGLPALEKSLTSANVQSWVGKLQKRRVNVFIPKFKMETAYTTNGALTAMGMVRAFVNPAAGSNAADFTGMCSIPNPTPDQMLYIGLVVHKAFVEVDEKGTEAAAATGVPMRPGAAPPSRMVPFTPTFRADKPFLFLIRDKHTGCILFLGRMLSPRK